MSVELTNLQWDLVKEALTKLAADRYYLQGNIESIREKVCMIADTVSEIDRQLTR